MITYISFCGNISTPNKPIMDKLSQKFTLQEHEIFEGIDTRGEERYRYRSAGFRDGLNYEYIGGKDSLSVYVARINGGVGHLVADCQDGGWSEETFCYLDLDGNPIKANNFNPNPVPQAI